MSEPLNYTLLVMQAPDTGRAQDRALGFAGALQTRGHRLRRVFFMGAGVRVAQPWDGGQPAAWQALAVSHGAELILCSASAERYDITEPPTGYVVAGLGALMEAGLDSDRVLTFA